MHTGAHLAWAVPAVQIVTQTPAFAASGPAALTVTATNNGWTGATTAAARFTVNVNVTNNNNQPTSDLRVTFTLPTGVTATVALPVGWTQVSNVANVIVIDKTNPQLGANASTGFFAVEFNPVDTSVGNEIVVGVSASPGLTGTPGSTSTTVAAAPPVLTLSPVAGAWVSGGQANATVIFSNPPRTITNTGLYQTTTGLKVVVTLPGAPFPIVQATLDALTTAGAAWTATRTGDREVTFTAVAQLAPGSSVTFLPNIRTQGNVQSESGTINFTVSATNTPSSPAGTATKP